MLNHLLVYEFFKPNGEREVKEPKTSGQYVAVGIVWAVPGKIYLDQFRGWIKRKCMQVIQ